MASFHIGTSIRLKIATSLLGYSSIRTKSLGVEKYYNIELSDKYDYYIPDDSDPEDVYKEFEYLTNTVAKTLKRQPDHDLFDQHLVETLATMVYGSNLIESAGAGLDMTVKLCEAVFKAEEIHEEIIERDNEYELLKRELMAKKLPHSYLAVLQSHREIIQHAKAARYMIEQVCIDGRDISEEIILETHRILTFKIDTDQGTPWTEYSGAYRKCPVSTGFQSYMEHTRVPYAMQKMIKGLQSDLQEAEQLGDIDPVGLAAKYCHIFVNIHPFLDGNGRMCRLILNSILLKYSGTLVCIGQTEDDRDEYLRIASSASYREQNSEDLDGIPEDLKPQHFNELATFTLLHARESLRKYISVLPKNGDEGQRRTRDP
ncbi:unnamed protein product [Clonostachys rosea]|uniref:Fido domain-containing protein n=1 Tax=Bionectria ochroleuca TaxID=29856 RepID=A0ABY6TQC2_BIOOC|nr:unnamed protein product [Clonostachys rosea]